MIRKMRIKEIDEVGQIWLNGNLEAHNFIDKNYWINNLTMVKEKFKEADIYVYVVDNKIKGFVGLQGNYIAGIFITKDSRNQGIGRQLLDYLKQDHSKLILDVYAKNTRAKSFYKNNGFEINSETVDTDNDEQDYQLIWIR